MELSIFERQTLVNQYDILERLATDEHDKKFYSERKEIYEQGFEGEYFEYGPNEEVLSSDECELVYKIVNMFDDLYYYWLNSSEIKDNIDEYKVMFSGFDLNDSVEHKYYSFVKFLIKDQGKFHDTRKLLESKKIMDLNSHGMGPKLSGYTSMVERFEICHKEMIKRKDNMLTLEEVKSVINI